SLSFSHRSKLHHLPYIIDAGYNGHDGSDTHPLAKLVKLKLCRPAAGAFDLEKVGLSIFDSEDVWPSAHVRTAVDFACATTIQTVQVFQNPFDDTFFSRHFLIPP